MIMIIYIEKPGKAIYLLKERSKLVRIKKNKKSFQLGSRLGGSLGNDEEMKDQADPSNKIRKVDQSFGKSRQI